MKKKKKKKKVKSEGRREYKYLQNSIYIVEAEKKTFALGIIQRLLFHCSVCDGLRCVFLPVCKEAGMEAHASLACMDFP
jgi:hypothetical protein